MLYLPAPGIVDRLRSYLRQRWKEFIFLAIFIVSVVTMLYTLALQNIYYDTPGNTTRLFPAKDDGTVPSPLTGVQVTPALAQRHVTGVMIENSPDARPQTSLSKAGIVFETVAEGGITRYLALYQEARPRVIGPVRSLREYYLDWVMGFDAPFAHAGGAAPALDLAQKRKAKSMNALIYGASFYRVSDRVAPHNLYTSTPRLDALAKALKYNRPSKFKSYARTSKEKPNLTPRAVRIKAKYSGPLYATEFRYGVKTNSYRRYLAGVADKDRAGGTQINPKNVVIIDMPASYNGIYAVLKTFGSGKAIVFRDGVVIKCTWKKTKPTSPLRLIDKTGHDIELNPGQTWFSVVPSNTGSYSYGAR